MIKWNKLGRFSAYARAESHLLQHTTYGAIVTVVGVITAFILFTSELREQLTPYVVQKMSVDISRQQFIRINFNLTFPSLPCQVLSLDAADMSGVHNTDFASNGEVHKVRIDSEGQRIGLGEYIAPRRWGFTLRRPREEVAALNQAMDAHEGCNLAGWLDVQRVAGNFHISVHAEDFLMLTKTQESIAAALQKQLAKMERDRSGSDQLLELPSDTTGINSSHVIHKLSFGASEFPGQVNPLDGFRRFVDTDSGTFKYFLKVVPTEYADLQGKRLQGNQYAVTEYYTPVHKGDTHMPAVWFVYDISPISVSIARTRRSLAHLLVRCCAVVGGVFAVTGMIDRWVHRLVQLL
ncbi:hypothetical protein WJX81_007031 [Elliptochloris bilobata]|uniref:Uncharacterized protein n=1 Tax=Elliptochloris bilobata TaxID=381761 RepID=A0AAW1RKR4_9CHLO